MIKLTRLNHQEITINSDLIECIESMPDTLVKLTDGETFMVLESVDEVVQKVVDFKRRIFSPKPIISV
jgi:flagellar protein FlbD